MPRAARILAGLIGNMSIELRLIEAADVLYDGTPDDAGSGMCFDWFTPRMLITGEGHERHELLSQFMPLFPPFQMHSVHRRAQLVRFHRRPRADHVRSHGFADLAPQAQAAAIVARFKRSTCPPRMLAHTIRDDPVPRNRAAHRGHACWTARAPPRRQLALCLSRPRESMARRGGGNGTGVGRGRLFEEILIANKGYVLLVDGSTSPPPPSPALPPPIPSITVITGTIRENATLESEKLGPRREHPQQAFFSRKPTTDRANSVHAPWKSRTAAEVTGTKNELHIQMLLTRRLARSRALAARRPAFAPSGRSLPT